MRGRLYRASYGETSRNSSGFSICFCTRSPTTTRAARNLETWVLSLPSGLEGRPQRRGAALAGLEAQGVEDRQHEHLPVAGVAGVVGGVDRLQHVVHFLVMTDDLQTDAPGQFQAHELAVFRMGGVVLLAEAAGVRDAHPMDMFADQGILNPVHQVGRDEGKQVFHTQYSGFSDSKLGYSIGSSSRVSKVGVSSPPMITTAKGRVVSAPPPVDRAAGGKPSAAMSEVIITGRPRDTAPSIMASRRGLPRRRNSRTRSTSSTPLWMETPNSAISPTIAETDKSSRAMSRASTPPTAAKGTFSRMRVASLPESNAVKRRKKMAMMVTGTTRARRWTARCSFSKAPVQTIR